jgi:hypothetical protein
MRFSVEIRLEYFGNQVSIANKFESSRAVLSRYADVPFR